MTIEVLLLGAAQDAGLPQLGCHCANCTAVAAGTLEPDTAVSLALIDREDRRFWLVDATPDIREQLARVEAFVPGAELAGVLLTHTHIGHYTGLMFLGRESMNTSQVPVHASARVCDFLREHAPWQQLVELGNIRLQPVSPGVEIGLTLELSYVATEVPHRSEYGDTLAFSLRGNERTLFFCPDIDRWDDWNHAIADVVDAHHVSLLDATFFDDTELPGRDMSEIPHPLAVDTAARLEGSRREVRLIHLNHTNPLYREGPAREFVRSRGLEVGQAGLTWSL